MNSRLFLCVLLCAFFVAPSLQYGLLRVEEIWSTEDIPQVKIEDMIIEESQIYIDYIEDLSGEGVTVEDVIFSDGSITIPGDFLTCCGVEFKSALYANRGVFADNGGSGFSFTIEDNTGDVTMQGGLRFQDSINASDRFFVDGRNGDTRIEGLFNPNGGVFTQNDAVSLEIDGEITVTGNTQVTGSVYFGEDATTSNRVITRLATESPNGGNTYLMSQDASERGGDLRLEPGEGASIGNIFLATSRNSELYFGRASLATTDNGGQTVISGQTSFSGDGGDLFFDGGNSGNIGFGGDILLVPGLSSLDGRPGKMIIGSPQGDDATSNIIAGRPPVVSGNGGETIFEGQTTLNGVGGNFYLRGGSVSSGTGVPGDVILTPGVANGQSTVFLGKNTATQLNIRRLQTTTAGGSTKFLAQNSTVGAGGDFFIRGGTSGTGNSGGDIYLVPGSSLHGETGEIILGVESDALSVRRPSVSNAAGGSTTISGQDGLDGVGGDLFLLSGVGVSHGGDVVVQGGSGNVGGRVLINGGIGDYQGGEVTVRAGTGTQNNGGDITIGTDGGDILVNAFGAVRSGAIVIGPASARLYVDEVPVTVRDATVSINSGMDSLVFSADPENILSWNGNTILKATQPIPVPRTTAAAITDINLTDVINNLSLDFDDILQAVNQCGHGLVESTTQPDELRQTCA